MLEFLRLHPHIAAQYERFLSGEPECSGASAPSTDKKIVVVDEDSGCISRVSDRRNDPTGILRAPWPIHLDPPRPPARGKLLSIPAAYKYLLGCKAAFDLVYDEFFCQVTRGPANSCWLLNKEPKRNTRGYYVKKVQIHHLAKSMPAVQTAYLLEKGLECATNLYNTCGEERCIRPSHHNAGKPYCAEKKFRLRKAEVPASDKTREDHLDAILGRLGLEPEKGMSITDLTNSFVAQGMGFDDFKLAMELGKADDRLWLRRWDNRIYLKNYPSATTKQAAERALDKQESGPLVVFP
jgi:hypothetical protein